MNYAIIRAKLEFYSIFIDSRLTRVQFLNIMSTI